LDGSPHLLVGFDCGVVGGVVVLFDLLLARTRRTHRTKSQIANRKYVLPCSMRDGGRVRLCCAALLHFTKHQTPAPQAGHAQM
jgi:hypothetical protein